MRKSDKLNTKAKTNSLYYIIIFVFIQVFGGSVLSSFNVELISNNLTFFAYCLLFAAAMALFHPQLEAAIKSFKLKFLKPMLIIGVISLLSINLWGLITDATNIVNYNNKKINILLNSSPVMTAVAVIIFAPTAEELFFHFAMLKFLEKAGHVLSHICVALAFGFFHVWTYVLIERDYIQLVNMIPYFVLSLAFSAVYKKTNNILSPIILHLTINVAATLV